MGLLDLDNNINTGHPPFDFMAERAIEVLKPNEMFGPCTVENIPYDIKDERVWFYVLNLRKSIKIPYNEFIGAYNVSISGNLPYSQAIKLSDFELPVGNQLTILDTVIDKEFIDFSAYEIISFYGCKFTKYLTRIKVNPNLKYIKMDNCDLKDWSGLYDYNIKVEGIDESKYEINHCSRTSSMFIDRKRKL